MKLDISKNLHSNQEFNKTMKLQYKPKIGIFTKPIDQGTSGSGSYLRQLVNQILKLNKKFNIVLIHHSKNDNEVYKKAKDLIISKNPLFAYIKLKKENFDLLHYYPLTITSPIWIKKPKKVTSVHGGGAAELYFPSQFSYIKRLHSKLIKPKFFRKMDYIFVGSNIGKKFLTRQYNVKEDKIFFTYSAVNEDFRIYENKPIEIKKKYGIEGPFIFHLSKFSERKNPWTIMKAFQKVKIINDKIKLVLGGKGWKNIKVIDFARKNEIFKDIIFTGFIPQEDLIHLLNLADVFVFPSFFEGFGIPNLEAMACGCPVITSNAFAIREIVGDAALLLEDNSNPEELAKKIILLISDKKLRDEFIKKGLARLKLFSWEKSAQTVLKIYERCLNL
ncbi:MAG: glycosyltransferase family 4 protein [Promethearchaeota archaeon]